MFKGTSDSNSYPKRSTESGKKYQTDQGFSAIKDGIKRKEVQNVYTCRKPEWLKTEKKGYTKTYLKIRSLTKKYNLSTVCEEAKCPNMNECWSNSMATIMLMGKVCTRACKFCSVDTGNPQGWLDVNEPTNTAMTIKLMGIKYVVITSVDRDDLADGGAAHYAKTINEIKRLIPEIQVEALTPDFRGDKSALDKLISTDLTVFAQNLETVERLTKKLRDPRAGYWQTIDALEYVKLKKPGILTKTSLMLGLGEEQEEVWKTMDDLRKANVDILTLGHYMQPTKHHIAVERFVTLQEFDNYREVGLEKGFLELASGPMVRSSYRADRIFNRNNLNL